MPYLRLGKPPLAFMLGKCARVGVHWSGVGMVVLNHGRGQATCLLGNMVGSGRKLHPFPGWSEKASLDLKPSAPDSKKGRSCSSKGDLEGRSYQKKHCLSSFEDQGNTPRNLNFHSGNTSSPSRIFVLLLILASTVLCCMFPHLAYVCGIQAIYSALFYFGRGLII